MSNRITLEPIGFVSSPVTEQMDSGWGKVVSTIELAEHLRPGAKGLEQFSHAVVVTFLHEAKFDSAKHLQRRPRELDSMPLLGIFSQRAKDRPNPIGVTAVRIVGVSEVGVSVQGLDAIDGTPVLDIKPYVPHFDCEENATVPSWLDELMKGYF